MSARSAEKLAIAVAQLNSTVGDIAGNVEKAKRAHASAAAQGADLVVFPELFIAGYPPEDLVLKPAFQTACRSAVEALARDTTSAGPALLVGTPWLDSGKLYNAVALLDGGSITALRYKVDLPNYGVFDEKRVFVPGPMPGPVNFRGVRLGFPICEDIWGAEVVECLAETGAEMLVVPNGSPYWRQKGDVRLNIAVARVTEQGLPTVYVNQVGGQDELVFDGVSFGLHADCSLAFQLASFQETIVTTQWVRKSGTWRCENGLVVDGVEADHADYTACMLGLRDYVNKNGFPGVVLGLSGGIDSALCAAMAVDALGAQRVRCLMLPFKFTSQASLDDAAAFAKALGVRYDILPIASAVEGVEVALAQVFSGLPRDVTEENLQARARGTILMAISNKFNLMVVTTGNKSEMSVGYATLYGDMNGGFNPIKDVYKTEVYRLATWRNCNRPDGLKGPLCDLIPERIISKAPTAELRENQTDQDTLPPYDALDDILTCLVENEMPVADIVKRGHAEALVKRVQHMLYVAEYKRRQAAPGVKITRRNFGRDRRYPIVNGFRDGR
jgi:NAD+ synthase